MLLRCRDDEMVSRIREVQTKLCGGDAEVAWREGKLLFELFVLLNLIITTITLLIACAKGIHPRSCRLSRDASTRGGDIVWTEQWTRQHRGGISLSGFKDCLHHLRLRSVLASLKTSLPEACAVNPRLLQA